MLATPAAASAGPLPLVHLAPDDAPASVLGLDSKDAAAGTKLTLALRKAFANRGLSGGEEISLEEMRLTMGCTNDGVACLAEGGKTLGVRRLVFGYLAPSGSAYQLDIQILDVEAGTLEAQASMQITKEQLTDGAIDQTATDIVNELMPRPKEELDLPSRPEPMPEIEPEPEPEEDEPRPEREIYFGLEKPTPGWKWGGFGTALGLTVLAGGATLGLGIWLSGKNGGFRDKLLEEAEASLRDDKELNDVDPNMPRSVNLCEFARQRPTDPVTDEPLGEPGQVRNAKIVNLCNDADDLKRVQIGTAVGAAVFGATTLVFTGLLLIHKRKPATNAMRRHDIRLGVAPNAQGGVSFAGGMRF